MAHIITFPNMHLSIGAAECDLHMAHVELETARNQHVLGKDPWDTDYNRHNADRYFAARERLFAAQDVLREARKVADHG